MLPGSTVPGFWLGLPMILRLAVTLGWFPVQGACTASAPILPLPTIGPGSVALVARSCATQ